MADKSTRAEVIAALVIDKYSGFKDGDENILEAASDARLDEFRAAADRARSAEGAYSRLETENRNVAARLKVSEDRIRTLEQPMTTEDFVQKAPPEIKALLEEKKAEEDAIRAAFVASLKDCGANTEEELKKKPIDELRMLAKYARVDVPDYSGRGLTRERNAEDKRSYAPPSPYDAQLKALREKSAKAVN